MKNMLNKVAVITGLLVVLAFFVGALAWKVYDESFGIPKASVGNCVSQPVVVVSCVVDCGACEGCAVTTASPTPTVSQTYTTVYEMYTTPTVPTVCCTSTPVGGHTPIPEPTNTDAPPPTATPVQPTLVKPTDTPPSPQTATISPPEHTPTPDVVEKPKCNRGVGNGAEDCDPGNSGGQGKGKGRKAGEDREE